MDMNSSNTATDSTQTDTPTNEDASSLQTPAPVDPTTNDDSPTSDDSSQGIPTDPETSSDQKTSSDGNDPQTSSDDPGKENYIENVGGGEIGLLDEISNKDTLLSQVALEMQLDTTKVKAILTTLLEKIDQGQITSEEIALILASTVADELTSDEEIL